MSSHCVQRPRWTAVAGVCALLAVLTAGCGAPGHADEAGAARVEAVYDAATGRLAKIAYDSTGSGNPDTWAYMDGAKLVRLEADEDEDGRVDRWEFYPDDAAGAGLKRAPDRIERATRLDGRISRREFFEGGAMVRVEEDTDGDGATDKWETYVAGVLSVLALDTTGRGKPDRRLIYQPDGSLERIEADPSGAGRFETLSRD